MTDFCHPWQEFSHLCGLGVGELAELTITIEIPVPGKISVVVVRWGAGGYQATATIRRSEFGLHSLQHIVSDEVEIIVAMNAQVG